MAHPVLDRELCIGCGICVETCTQGVLDMVGYAAGVVDEDACIACGDCVEACPALCITEIAED